MMAVLSASSVEERAVNYHSQKWKALGASCVKTDKKRAREGITRFYKLYNRPIPERIIWLESPLAGAITVALLEKRPMAAALLSVRQRLPARWQQHHEISRYHYDRRRTR